MEIARGSAEAEDRLSQTELWKSMHRHFAEFLAPPPHGSMLEVGCGTGRLSLLWSRLIASVTGVDASPEHLARAEALSLEAGLKHMRFQEASPSALPFHDGSFDVVTGFSVLCEAPDPVKPLTEMARVIRPGGIFGAVVPSCRLEPARIDAFVARHGLPSEIAAALHRFAHINPGGYKERPLELLLLGAGLRAVRTIEQADGMMLVVKAWR